MTRAAGNQRAAAHTHTCMFCNNLPTQSPTFCIILMSIIYFDPKLIISKDNQQKGCSVDFVFSHFSISMRTFNTTPKETDFTGIF